jgi:hypothetical protein
MSVAVAKEIMFLQNKMEDIKDLQRKKDAEQGRDPTQTARQRLAATRGDQPEIIINSSDTEKFEQKISAVKPKFAQLHKLMDGLNKVTAEMETLQPHLKTL